MNTQNTMASLCHSKFRSTQNNGITLLSCLSHGACFGKGSIHSCQPSSIAREIHAFLTYLTPASRLVFFLTRNSSLTFHKWKKKSKNLFLLISPASLISPVSAHELLTGRPAASFLQIITLWLLDLRQRYTVQFVCRRIISRNSNITSISLCDSTLAIMGWRGRDTLWNIFHEINI